MRKMSFTRRLLLLFVMLASAGVTQAQVTTNSGSGLAASYPSLGAAITALNSATISSPVTITLTAGETAPVGGYSITAAGSSTNTITIDGGGFTVTAFTPQAAGGRLDAIFKIVGGDYITIQNFTMAENAANTVTAVATNTMTEFGVALFYNTTTDGAQNNTVKNNTITLSPAYQNAMGIYSNTTHSATSYSAAANATANTGLNSNLKIYGNNISGVGYGIMVITPPNTATVTESGVDIGGTSAATGNTVTYGFTAVADAGWNGFSTATCGIGYRNGVAVNIRYNTVTSNNMAIATTGILLSAGTSPASAVTYTNTVSNNTVNVTQTGTAAATGIDFGYGNANGTMTGNANTVNVTQSVAAAASSAITGIKANYTFATTNLTSNLITITESTSAGSMTSTLYGIRNEPAAASTTQTISSNTITFKQNAATGTGSYGSGTMYYIVSQNSTTAVNIATGTISNNQLLTTGSTLRTTGSVYGINHDYTYSTGITLNGNTINLDRTGAGSTYGIYATTSGSSALVTLTNNAFTLTGSVASGAATVFNEQDGIGATSTTKTINNNTVSITAPSLASTVSLFTTNYANGTLSNNQFTIATAGSITGTTFGSSGGSFTISGNTFSLTSSGTSPTIAAISASTISSGSYTVTNNTFAALSATAAGTNAPSVTAISVGAGTGSSIYGNTITNISTGAGSGSATITGIAITGGTSANVYKNKVYDLSTSCTGTSTLINDILISGGTTVNVYNNLVGQSGALAGVNAVDAIRGISITSGSSSAANVYYNTVLLNASSTGTNFGTSGIYATASSTATTAALDLRNNIVLNLSTPSGTGITAAYRRSAAATLGNYAATSNRNLLYGGTPGATRLIMYDGTNSYQAMAAYQAAVGTRDANSFTGEPAFDYAGGATTFFTSTTGAAATYLKPSAGITTQVESGAAAISGITDDYNAVARPASGTAPDLGAWEFAGVTPTPVITLNSVTPGTTAQCTATARVVNVTVTPGSGTVTSVVLNYNNGAAGSTTMTLVSGTTYTGTIPAAAPVNANVTWSITATNSVGLIGTYTGTAYQDAPLFGFTATATASATTSCAGLNDTLTAKLLSTGTVTLGTSSATTTSNTANTPYSAVYEGAREQYIIRAGELQALGLNAGNLTSLAFNVTAAGSYTQSGFTIKLAHTAATTLNGAYGTPSGSFTTVYGPVALPTPATGWNTYNFSTNFVWDGVSNILVDVCHDNDINASCSLCYGSNSTVQYTATAYNSCYGSYADNAQSCGTTAANTLSSTYYTYRPNMMFGGTIALPATAYTWSNGATTVGTTNPLVVTPATTTTYNATITASGCPATTNNVTVNVNPLPIAPTVSNSNQCGTQVPTASVADPNGYTGPIFKWYAAASGGTALQAATSATYTTAIATTTTFYVSVTNPGTGCESNRTPVTITVSTPDAVTAKANGLAANTGTCLNSNVNLSSVQTGTTNNYTYTWTASPATGSGIATSTAGQNITVTPTAAGIYTYTVTAVDGSCTTTSTVTDTVKNPFAGATITATASPATNCAGANDTLRVTALNVVTAATGAQTTTEFGGGVYRNGYGTGDFRHQLLYTAAELTAAGFSAGNITSIAFNVTSAGSGSANNYAIKLANVATTALTTSFAGATFTNVYNAATYTAVAGNNVHTFTTPFYWDGISNVLVDICYNISSIGSSSTLAATTPAATMNVNLLGTTGACTAATGTTYANRPVATFSINAAPIPSSYSWSNGATVVGTTNPLVVNPAVNTTYTATITANGCSAASAPATVTIVPLSAATATATSAVICAGRSDTLSAAATGAGAPFTYSWSDGATVVGTTQSITVTPASTKTYTVTITNTCLQTVTASSTITVNPLPAATASSNAPVCSGSTLNFTGTSNGTGFSWTGPGFSTPSVSQNPSISNVTTAASGVYTFVATSAAGCASAAATTTVLINQTPAALAVTPATAAICAGTVQQLSGSGAATYTSSLLSEGFNGATNTWTTINNSTGGTVANAAWTLRPNAYVYSTTTFKSNDSSQFYMTNSDAQGTGGVTNAILQSPSFSTVGATALSLDYYHHYKYWSSAANDSGIVEVSTNGTTWTPVKVYKGATTGSNTAFSHDTVSLNAYLGQSTVYVRFNFTTTYGYYWLVDNVSVNATLPQPHVWTPATGLYTNAAATIPYTGTNDSVVYAKPSATVTYTYTASSPAGCSSTATAAITVNQLPNASVAGAAALCVNATTTLTPTTTGGTWTSANPAIATVNSSGVVTGVAAGTDTIRYKVTNTSGCTDSSFKIITINALPNVAITGASVLCVNATTTLTPGSTGGTWSSSNTAVATVSNTGLVTGISAGTVTIKYKATNTSNCTDSATKVVIINALPNVTITGPSAVCVNGTITEVPGSTGGTWNSSNTAVATVNGAGVVTGISPGTATIRYVGTNASGCTDSSSKVITVNALPNVAITGAAALCVNATTTLTPGSPGGTWSSSNTAVATVSSAGVVTGVSAGTVTIKYKATNASNCTDSATKTVTINALPNVTITGPSAVCVNSAVTEVPGSTGGTWSSSNTAVATVNSGGVVTGVSAGTATIKYLATNVSGCTDSSTKAITVNALPVATVSGAAALCVNATTTLTPTTTGGTWTSSNPAIATVSSSGVVTGVAAGTDTIRYKVANTSGCIDSSFKIVTINALPNVTITGPSAVCVNSTVTEVPGSTGGTWSSSNTAVATVNSGGVVTGVSAGTATIKYMATNVSGCTDSSSKLITVNTTPNAAITGLASLCVNDTTTLTGATAGGAWTSSNPAIATINGTTGFVTGIAAGLDTITYSVNIGCAATATKVITIKALPSLTVTASGPTTFCANDSVILTAHAVNVTYQWLNGTTAVATDSVYTVHSSGVYTVIVAATNGCYNTTAPQSVTVNPLPVPVITANGVAMSTGTFTTYQWYYGGNIIPNATNSTYTATQNGDYTVVVTDGNSCSGTSVAYVMTKVGIDEHGGIKGIRIYPNPTKDIVYVDAPVPVNITVYSLDGRKIAYSEKAKSIDLGKFAAGAYTIMVTDESGSLKVIERIVKAE